MIWVFFILTLAAALGTTIGRYLSGNCDYCVGRRENDDSNKEVSVQYDSDHDILHIRIGELALYWDDEETPGIILLRRMSDEKLAGVRILAFKERFIDGK